MGFEHGFIIFLSYAFMFMCGSMLGWVLELFYRRFFSKNNPERKWINPGFLNGPCVPLYGFGLCALYAMSNIPIPISSRAAAELIRILLMGAAMTLIEYIAGIIFIKGMKVKLWDYSENWGNIDGIICPLFTFYWTLIAAVYSLLVSATVNDSIYWFVSHIWFSYFVGMFSSAFFIDFGVSVNLMTKIRAFAAEHEIVVKTEELKRQFREFKEEHNLKGGFTLAMHNRGSLYERLSEYVDKAHMKDGK